MSSCYCSRDGARLITQSMSSTDRENFLNITLGFDGMTHNNLPESFLPPAAAPHCREILNADSPKSFAAYKHLGVVSNEEITQRDFVLLLNGLSLCEERHARNGIVQIY